MLPAGQAYPLPHCPEEHRREIITTLSRVQSRKCVMGRPYDVFAGSTKAECDVSTAVVRFDAPSGPSTSVERKRPVAERASCFGGVYARCAASPVQAPFRAPGLLSASARRTPPLHRSRLNHRHVVGLNKRRRRARCGRLALTLSNLFGDVLGSVANGPNHVVAPIGGIGVRIRVGTTMVATCKG